MERRDAEPGDYFVVGLSELAEESVDTLLDSDQLKMPCERDFGAIFALGLVKVLANVARATVNSQLKEPISIGLHRKPEASDVSRNRFADKASAYALLGLRDGTSKTEIKERYKNLVRYYHPDASQNQATSEIFGQITDAYHSLMGDNSVI